jgi:hypothetical protein
VTVRGAIALAAVSAVAFATTGRARADELPPPPPFVIDEPLLADDLPDVHSRLYDPPAPDDRPYTLPAADLEPSHWRPAPGPAVRSLVREVLDASYPRLRGCLFRVGWTDPTVFFADDLATLVRVRVRADGRLRQIGARGATPALDRCAQREAGRLRYPATGEERTVDYFIDFRRATPPTGYGM